jgi:transposase
VIWTDETSVILEKRRGMIKLWIRNDELDKWNFDCVRRRYKNYSEFMFWACYTYGYKGPCYCWPIESKIDKELAQKELDAINNAINNAVKEEERIEFESLKYAQDLLREGSRKGGKKASFDVYWKNHKLVRKVTRGGIDWYRYQTHILRPLLLPFAQRMQLIRPDTIVQEDGAPGHVAKENRRIWIDFRVTRMIWPGNSPDLNMIEQAWFYLKRVTTRSKRLTSRAEAVKAWEKAWEELEQRRIDAWIEKIVDRIQTVIELKGGNEYPH